MSRLERILQAPLKGPDRRRRGLKRQRRARDAERTARLSTVAFARWLCRRGSTRRVVAGRLSMSASALSRWLRRWGENRMELCPRGRPPEDVDRDTRAGILSVFSLMGSHATLTALRDRFPSVARGALENLLERCRRVYRRRSRWLLHTLRWTRPGTVWAMDFTEAPEPIDGSYRYLLLIRDLPSGRQLLALPCDSQSSEVVIASLKTLFRWCGLPLILKMDNGSAFVAEEVKAFLTRHRVLPLYSPPGTPAYNGSVEAGIGSLEVRAFYESARHDRPGQWTSDDIAVARLQANATVRRFGPNSPTPDQAWNARTPITDLDSHLFRQAYDRERQRACAERAHAPDEPESHWLRASIDRVALSRALIQRGLLFIRSRRVTPPITLRSASRIS
jgi:transposase InsO family protein